MEDFYLQIAVKSLFHSKVYITEIRPIPVMQTSQQIPETEMPITIGDIYRAHRKYQGSLTELVSHHLMIGTSPCNENGER